MKLVATSFLSFFFYSTVLYNLIRQIESSFQLSHLLSSYLEKKSLHSHSCLFDCYLVNPLFFVVMERRSLIDWEDESL